MGVFGIMLGAATLSTGHDFFTGVWGVDVAIVGALMLFTILLIDLAIYSVTKYVTDGNHAEANYITKRFVPDYWEHSTSSGFILLHGVVIGWIGFALLFLQGVLAAPSQIKWLTLVTVLTGLLGYAILRLARFAYRVNDKITTHESKSSAHSTKESK